MKMFHEMDDMTRVFPEHGMDITIMTTDFREIRGWRHTLKETDLDHLAIMIGRRKTPEMVPVAKIMYWVRDWRSI